MNTYTHQTVLLHEAVQALAIEPDGVYVDGTFGRGGHTHLILTQLGANGRLIVFDKDPQAIQVAQELAQHDSRITVIHRGFSHLSNTLNELNIPHINGALFDLGISSPQIDDASRGFSFRFNAPLDMRMDNSQGQSASEWLAIADESSIHQVIRDYGEEKFSRQIARAIVQQRTIAPINTTEQLAQIVKQVVHSKDKQHPATRTFQAIRIFINRELDDLTAMLPQALEKLAENGRLAIIAFHSLEDRMVKQFIKQHSTPPPLPKWVAVREVDLPQPPLIAVGKAIKPSPSECQLNPRARSAVLRVAQRTSGNFTHV